MDNIKVDAYLPLCEQYNSLAQSFFQQHLYFKNESKQLGKSVDYFDNPIQALKQNECAIAMLQTAICAVVFEAFAIESYTNFSEHIDWEIPYITQTMNPEKKEKDTLPFVR